jgi:hypothetical protein
MSSIFEKIIRKGKKKSKDSPSAADQSSSGSETTNISSTSPASRLPNSKAAQVEASLKADNAAKCKRNIAHPALVDASYPKSTTSETKSVAANEQTTSSDHEE